MAGKSEMAEVDLKNEEKISDDSEKNGSCGWFWFRPKGMHGLGSPLVLLMLLCGYFFTNSAVINGIFSSSISTIENRFALTSSQMGMVTSIYDVAALIFIGPVSYFGVRNKPVMLGVGMITMGVGYIVFLSPHLIAEAYVPVTGRASNYSSPLICASKDQRAPSAACGANEESNVFYGIFALAMFIAGAGCAPMITLGIPFMDETVSPAMSAIYIGIFNSSGIISAVAGFFLASVFLKIFVHPNSSVSITSSSPTWIGAWWLGFAIGAVFALIIGVALTALPKNIRRNAEHEEENEKKPESKEETQEHPTLREFPAVLKRLILENPTFVLISIALSLQNFLISGSTAFMPKIALFQFQLTASEASVYQGLTAGTAALIGSMAGSFYVKQRRLSSLGILKNTAVASLCCVVLVLYAFIYCDTYPSPGINAMFPNSSSGISLNNKCNTNCSCTNGLFVPICAGGLTYVNPCLAGCKSLASPLSFTNCTCLMNQGLKVPVGLCKSSCGNRLVAFYVLQWLASFFIFFQATPSTIATLRCVPFKLRSFAMGLQWMLARVLGTIPGPVMFGYFIDKACIFWAKTCSNSKGSCRIYDKKQLALSIGTLSLVLSCLVSLSIFLAYTSFKKTIAQQGNPKATSGYAENIKSTDFKVAEENRNESTNL